MDQSHIVHQRIFIPALDSLRFIFMLVIFFHHAGLYPHGGGIAVSFFFILSGFSLTLGYHDRVFQPDFSFVEYITKRLVKFYPIHWLVLFMVVALTGIHIEYFLGKFFTNFFLVQSFIPDKEYYFSFNSPSWFLCNTIFFSLLFPSLLRGVYSLKPISKIALFFLLVTLSFLLVIFVPREYHHAVLYINPLTRLIDFVVGILTALLFLRITDNVTLGCSGQIGSILIAIFCLFTAFIVSVISVEGTYVLIRFYWFLMAPFILFFSLWAFYHENNISKKLIWGGHFSVAKTLRWLGKYSFTFYVIHVQGMWFFGKILGYINVYNTAIVMVVTVLGTLLISIILQNLFVMPVSGFLMKRLLSKRNGNN